MWWTRKIRRRRASTVTKHYLENKKAARELVLARLAHFNQHYNLEWKRVAIRNQRRCWGSCSSLGNLNFNYKILLLPPHLADYIIVHELCHLKHLHHGREFWDLVAEQLPDYKQRMMEVKRIDKLGGSIKILERIQNDYVVNSKVIVQRKVKSAHNLRK